MTRTCICLRCSSRFEGFFLGRSWYCERCRFALQEARRVALKWVRLAINTGRLLPAKAYRCSDCFFRWATGWEHRDYDKPLDIEPTCDSCNFKRGPARFSEVLSV